VSKLLLTRFPLVEYHLDPSHDWQKDDGNCWHGEHSFMWCANCYIRPFVEEVCYHELPRPDVTVNSLAIQPCEREQLLIITKTE
jgi:hypothetical protein